MGNFFPFHLARYKRLIYDLTNLNFEYSRFASWGWLCHVPDYLNLLICPEATRRAAILDEPTDFVILITAAFFEARSPRWPRAYPPQASSEGSGLEKVSRR